MGGIHTDPSRFGLAPERAVQPDSNLPAQPCPVVSNRFRQRGVHYTTGMQADRAYRFFGPEGSIRILRKLDLAYGAGIQNYDVTTQQHILTMNYEFSPTRSIGGRVVVQDAQTNWYVSFRNSGERGTEVYFIIGDPNALRFREQVRMKLVFAI
jgi:hypothetical protein